jgi:hypothetical protein
MGAKEKAIIHIGFSRRIHLKITTKNSNLITSSLFERN